MASRRYRQKKKVLIDQLEAKLKELMHEKDRIEKEHQNTLEIVKKLRLGNREQQKDDTEGVRLIG
jgi:hypothetical protein